MIEESILKIEQNNIEPTDERLVVNKQVKETQQDLIELHVNRYAHACKYVKNKKVLDAACGAGYGTKILNNAGAKSVTGIDISSECIAEASKYYGGADIDFKIGDVINTGLHDGEFDVIVSFETIEHIDSGKAWISEAARLLNDNGVFIVSTPNRRVTNHLKEFEDTVRNPYHKYEYTLSEFIGEISTQFEICEIYGQSFIPDRLMSSRFSNIKILKYYYESRVAQSTNFYGKFIRVIRFIKKSLRKKDNPERKQMEPNNEHDVVNLSDIKNMQPMYIIAVCKKKKTVKTS